MTKEKELHIHDENCGCEETHDTITLTLEDGQELECPVIEIFEIENQEYIALLHPEDQTALIYRFSEFDDDSIEITSIESDEEFEKVAEYMNSQYN